MSQSSTDKTTESWMPVSGQPVAHEDLSDRASIKALLELIEAALGKNEAQKAEAERTEAQKTLLVIKKLFDCHLPDRKITEGEQGQITSILQGCTRIYAAGGIYNADTAEANALMAIAKEIAKGNKSHPTSKKVLGLSEEDCRVPSNDCVFGPLRFRNKASVGPARQLDNEDLRLPIKFLESAYSFNKKGSLPFVTYVLAGTFFISMTPLRYQNPKNNKRKVMVKLHSWCHLVGLEPLQVGVEGAVSYSKKEMAAHFILGTGKLELVSNLFVACTILPLQAIEYGALSAARKLGDFAEEVLLQKYSNAHYMKAVRGALLLLAGLTIAALTLTAVICRVASALLFPILAPKRAYEMAKAGLAPVSANMMLAYIVFTYTAIVLFASPIIMVLAAKAGCVSFIHGVCSVLNNIPLLGWAGQFIGATFNGWASILLGGASVSLAASQATATVMVSGAASSLFSYVVESRHKGHVDEQTEPVSSEVFKSYLD